MKSQVISLTWEEQSINTLAGSETYTSALSIYKVLKNAAGMGQPGAEEASRELSNRFPRGKRKGEVVGGN